MILPVRLSLLLALCLSLPVAAFAGPVEDAKGFVAEGDALLQTLEKAKANKRLEIQTEAIRRFARAYMLITNQKLQNDAPELLKDIEKRLDDANALGEIATLRHDLLVQSIDAAAANELTKAYDHLSAARDLDPRDRSVEYALRVIGQRMGDK